MAQETLVTKVPKGSFDAVRARIAAGPFQFRTVPHAFFSVKGSDVVATLYQSGKFVVQGSDPAAFLARWTELEVEPSEPKTPAVPKSDVATKDELAEDDPLVGLEPPLTGSDEAGKGDYFGPLVVAAVRVDAEGLEWLRGTGVADSKALSDSRVLKLAVALRERVEHSVRRVDPNEYNGIYPTYPALNPYLADLHAEAIRAVAKRGENVIVDQFERRGFVRRALDSTGVALTEVTRAERHPVVAAASILARQEFLLGLAELSETFGVTLRKGAGEPTDAAGVTLVRREGEAALRGAAKLHFKNTDKILARV